MRKNDEPADSVVPANKLISIGRCSPCRRRRAFKFEPSFSPRNLSFQATNPAPELGELGRETQSPQLKGRSLCSVNAVLHREGADMSGPLHLRQYLRTVVPGWVAKMLHRTLNPRLQLRFRL